MPTILTAKSGMSSPGAGAVRDPFWHPGVTEGMGLAPMGRGMKKRRGTMHEAQLAELAARGDTAAILKGYMPGMSQFPRGAAPFKGPNAVPGYSPGY